MTSISMPGSSKPNQVPEGRQEKPLLWLWPIQSSLRDSMFLFGNPGVKTPDYFQKSFWDLFPIGLLLAKSSRIALFDFGPRLR